MSIKSDCLDKILLEYTYKSIDKPNEAALINSRIFIDKLNIFEKLMPSSIHFSYLGGIEFIFKAHRAHCTIDCLNDLSFLVYFFKFGYIKTEDIDISEADSIILEMYDFLGLSNEAKDTDPCGDDKLRKIDLC